MQNFKSSAVTVTELFLHEEEAEGDEESVKIVFTCIFYLVIFSSNFLHAVTTFMSLKVRLKVKTENILMHGYNAGPPMAIPIYTVLW